MPEPEKVDASSQPLATGMQQQLYKRLLNEQVQKLRKQVPVYQTNNEGAGHQPKFRTTIWIDGVKYTSPNTFHNRKLAETDASKFTLFAIRQKLKDEALNHLCEDKIFCKAILMEYAVRMNTQRPTYQTTQLGSSPPVFRCCLVFNGASFTGDDCRSKKEAEQSAARAVILKYLESETGIMLSEIIKSKFNHIPTKDIQIAQSDTNVVNGLVALNEAKSNEVTKIPLLITTTTSTSTPVNITQTLETPIIPVSTSTLPTYSPPLMTPQIPTQTTTPVSTVLAQTPLIQSIQTPTQTTPVPIQTPPVVVGTTFSNVVQQDTAIPVTQTPTQTLSMPTVMAQTPTPNVLAQTPSISVTSIAPYNPAIQVSNNSSNSVAQPINSEALLPPVTVAASSLPVSTPVTGKKRKNKNKKNAQKRMRAENQVAMSAMFHGQVPTFSAQ
ncbi:double-stranded RNA-binding protein 2 [Lactuca sativa]|uniref:double-stranded RNA-binding protein 2 n=1 Tax=Lactuca sativa TaxID=4236 RepID=UPI000CD939FC|nr:double-stranded RNA-binding protein 2 [Lactuca sativa]XP_023751912.1 double-stranded RNA-binding protein 2 [Lactuca sativa]